MLHRHGRFDHSLKSLTNEPYTSQELMADCFFGGFADKRKLLKDERMNLSARFSVPKHMKHVVARAIACSVMLLVFPSCGIPPLRHWEPGPGLPTYFNGTTSPENSAELGIEEFYNDRMLIGLIEKALPTIGS